MQVFGLPHHVIRTGKLASQRRSRARAEPAPAQKRCGPGLDASAPVTSCRTGSTASMNTSTPSPTSKTTIARTAGLPVPPSHMY
jgi:hypothetical protein